MADQSHNLALPYIQPAQAQKHVTHNEALRILDTLTQLSVESAQTQEPPTGAQDGVRYILPGDATGVWSGRADVLAVWENGGWFYYDPLPGMVAWVRDTQSLQVFDDLGGWRAVSADMDSLTKLGIATTADDTNRLAVASDAVLLTHDGADHRLKINKAAQTDTASVLFQTGFSGRAEMGLAGGDDFEVKTSADGTTFQQSIVADAQTGVVRFPSGVEGLTPADFGEGEVATTGYIASRGLDLVTNGTCLLGNDYNYPSSFTFDAAVAPNLPGSVRYEGYQTGTHEMEELLAVDPNQVYRLGCYVRQASVPGDWSAFTNAERHSQYMGMLFYDADSNLIQPHTHMRFRTGGVDSLTTLAAPLTPGDTQVILADAAGWNTTSAISYHRGITLYAYQNTAGYTYDYYSRLYGFNLFDLAGVDKTTNTITLNAPWPVALGNPDDPSGTWPVGTRLANSSSGSSLKYNFFQNFIPAQTDTWYATQSHIGGIDLSGNNTAHNFPPGTAFVRPFWIPNNTNYAGGFGAHPDTGADHAVWFAGISVTPDPLAQTQRAASGAQSGSVAIKVPTVDFASGAFSLTAATTRITAL